MIRAVLANHAHGTLTQLGGKFTGLHSGSIFSRVGASTKSGAIHNAALGMIFVCKIETSLSLAELILVADNLSEFQASLAAWVGTVYIAVL